MKAVQRDMTVGKPMKVIINFTLPIFIGNVFQQFYNMADAVIVAKFVGTKALAAVGSTGTIMFLGLCRGNDSRIYGSDSTEIRSGRYGWNEEDCCGGRHPFFGNRTFSDDCIYGIYETTSDSYEYTGGYFPGCICLYYDCQRRNPCTDAV